VAFLAVLDLAADRSQDLAPRTHRNEYGHFREALKNRHRRQNGILECPGSIALALIRKRRPEAFENALRIARYRPADRE
jgi:hypothetical protein